MIRNKKSSEKLPLICVGVKNRIQKKNDFKLKKKKGNSIKTLQH